MKRRVFLKFLGLAAAAPVVAPLAEKYLRAEQPQVPIVSEADKWRNMCGYGKESAATLSGVSVNALADPFLFKVGDIITIGNDPSHLLITKAFRHGEIMQSLHGRGRYGMPETWEWHNKPFDGEQS